MEKSTDTLKDDLELSSEAEDNNQDQGKGRQPSSSLSPDSVLKKIIKSPKGSGTPRKSKPNILRRILKCPHCNTSFGSSEKEYTRHVREDHRGSATATGKDEARRQPSAAAGKKPKQVSSRPDLDEDLTQHPSIHSSSDQGQGDLKDEDEGRNSDSNRALASLHVPIAMKQEHRIDHSFEASYKAFIDPKAEMAQKREEMESAAMQAEMAKEQAEMAKEQAKEGYVASVEKVLASMEERNQDLAKQLEEEKVAREEERSVSEELFGSKIKEIIKLKTQLEEQKTARSKVEESLAAKDHEIAELKNQFDVKDHENAELLEDVESLTSQLKKMEYAKEEIEKSKEEIERSKEYEMMSMRNVLEAKEKEGKKLKSQLESLAKQVKDSPNEMKAQMENMMKSQLENYQNFCLGMLDSIKVKDEYVEEDEDSESAAKKRKFEKTKDVNDN